MSCKRQISMRVRQKVRQVGKAGNAPLNNSFIKNTADRFDEKVKLGNIVILTKATGRSGKGKVAS